MLKISGVFESEPKCPTLRNYTNHLCPAHYFGGKDANM